MARNGPSSKPTHDTWVYYVPALALLYGAFFLALQARLGAVGIILWYFGPSVLALLSISVLIAALIASSRQRWGWDRSRVVGYFALLGLILLLPIYETYPSSYDNNPSRIGFRLPLDGPVRVAWGGRTAAVNYHVILPDQRWAYDLLVTNQGRTFWRDGASLEDYYSYNRAVVAPAAGSVQAAVDGEPDLPIGRKRWPSRALRALGNHVVLEVAPKEFLFIAHLRRGSIAVTAGTRVTTGQVIARVGNSGNSTEPHVHLHLQDTPTPYFGEGIPFYFERYRQAGMSVERGMPEGGLSGGAFVGQVVEHELR